MAYPRPYGRYILEDRLAMGGMAEIFRARTATAGFEKKVCIKRVLPNFLEEEDFVTMFRDEAKLAARLQHANVVQVFDFGEVDEGDTKTLYLAMELVEGADLRRLWDQSRKRHLPFSIGEVTQIGIDVCRGLHHAHTRHDDDGRPLGLVHRDISPHNILVSRSGEVKVTDFGIARAAERATHTSTGIVKGKVAYMSPEQAEGGAFDHRLDQWALGVVLWELLCSERLFRGDSDVAILTQVLSGTVQPPSSLRRDVPTELEEIVLRALRRRQDERFPTLREMELALSRFLLSGAIDPATADVGAAFARIMDGTAPPSPRRTALLDAGPELLTAPPPAASAPSTMPTEDIGALNVSGTVPSDSSLIDISVVNAVGGEPSSVSHVFVSSQPSPAAPGPSAASSNSQPSPSPSPSPSSSNAETLLELGRAELDAELDALTPRAPSQKQPAARETKRRETRAPIDTALEDGALVAAAHAIEASDRERTPATRTLIPATQGAPPAPAVPSTSATTLSTSKPPARGPRAALIAVALSAVGVVVGVALLSTSEPPPRSTSSAAGGSTSLPHPEATPSSLTSASTVPAAAATTTEPTRSTAPATTNSTLPTTPTTTPTLATAAAASPATSSTTTPRATKVPPSPVRPPAPPPPSPAPATTEARPSRDAAAIGADGDSRESATPGTVYVDVVGSWAYVSIGKQRFGDTPVTLTLPPGRYVVTLTSGDSSTKKNVTVTVTPGAKLQIRESL
jgi:serine/threonine protein kinase